MQTEKIASKYLPTKAMLIVRILVGGYLFYTAYSLIEGVKSVRGGELVFLCAAMAAFVAFGIGFILFSVKSLKAGKYKGGSMDAGEDAQTQETGRIEDMEEKDKTEE